MEQEARAAWLLELNGPYELNDYELNDSYIGPYITPAPPVHTHAPAPRVDTTGVEQWRSLAAEWFPEDKVDEALAIIWCESRGDPSAKNPISSASGLWQFLKAWWSGRWSSVVGVFDPFNPTQAMRAASIASKGGSDWGHWSESRHCHGL